MAYNPGVQQIVYRTSDGRVLRYGFSDFAESDDFDPGTETVIENGYRFEYGIKENKYRWTGSAIVDDGAYDKKNTGQILADIEDACTTQQWLDIQDYLDGHGMVFCCLDDNCYTKARARVQKAYDDTVITEALYNLIMAEIPTEDIP